MKKILGVAAVAALFATTAMAVTVDVRVVTDITGDATAQAGPNVPVLVQAQLSAGSQGLALIGFNIDVIPGGGAADADLCDTSGFLLMAPVGMANFDRLANPGPGFSNFGLTNPSASPNLSGYSGTCSGTKLLQLGGGQNTIGNTPGGAPYPIGTITNGVGNGGWVTIAEGSIDASSLTGAQTWTVEVDTVFANTLDAASGTPRAVTEATVGTLSSLAISAGILCPAEDVNCDGSITFLDLSVVTGPGNWLQAVPACDRADVQGGGVSFLDLAAVTAPGKWLTNHGACSCSTSTPGAGGCPTP